MIIENIKRVHVSVAMATYNGQAYIAQQIESILPNLMDEDELIISDDKSTDLTVEIINEFALKDKRIKMFDGPGQGVIRNFENAIERCNNPIIFLSDQDDIWSNNKVQVVLKSLESDQVIIVVHNATIMGDGNVNGATLFDLRNSGPGKIKNILKNSYVGCCMAFRRKLTNKILPFPTNIEMHDQWIGIQAERYGKASFISDNLIKYRRHENNVSSMKHYGFKKMLCNRINFIVAYIKRLGQR